MGDTAAEEQVLFEGGPPDKLQSWLGVMRADRPRFVLRAQLVIATVWLPLVVLTARGNLMASDGFLWDFGAQARFLVVPPLLVLAEAFCLPRLAAIARQFLSTGLIDAAAYPRYQYAVHSTRRGMNSTLVEVWVVLPSGAVYEKDLGANTSALAGAMTAFHKDATWRIAE